MRLLIFASAFGILVSIAVLVAVLVKAKRAEKPPRGDPRDN